MRKFSAIAVAVFFFMTSCKENTRVNLVSGKVYQDCISPLPNVEIALKSNVGGSFNAPIILGSGITAADGSLRFTYELDEEDLGTGSLLLVKSTGFEVLIDNVDLNQDVILDLFRNDLSQLIIQLSGTRTYGPTDTLFYGLTNNEGSFLTVQPVHGAIDTIEVYSSAPNTNNVSESFYFGIGTNNFLRAKASASISDSTYNKQNALLNGCASETVLNLVID